MKSNLMTVSVLTSLVNGVLGGKESSGEDLKPPPMSKDPATPGDVIKIRRERNSSTMYPWLRRINGRNYKVFNLDSRDPTTFKNATKQLGKSLATKVR